jgi:hypothetical protein
MNIIKMIRISDGKEFQGFIDREKMNYNLLFYYYDTEKNFWVSESILEFKPYTENETKVIGG